MVPKNNDSRFLARRQLVRALGLGALGLVACSKTPAPSKQMSASIGIVDWVGYAPLYVAREKGLFKELGLDLDVKLFQANGQVTAAFAAGRLDAQADVLSSATYLASRGKDFRVVLVADRSVGGDGILARNSIASIKDFKGKKIALEEISVSHYFLLQVLAEAGLQEKDVTIVNMTPGDAAAAYQSGNVEIAVTYAPFLGKANASRKDGRVLYDSLRMPYSIADIYQFDARFTEERPETVQAFVDGIFQGLAYIESNPEESADITARQLKVTTPEVVDYLRGVRLVDLKTNVDMLTNAESPGYLLKTMTDLAQFLKAAGRISSIPDLARIVEPKFVLASRQNA